MPRSNDGLITTIKERCRMCYTCVRECPAKAIRITDGQAEVLGERCIACGNCVRVCSQNAKLVRSSIDECRALVRSDARTAVCLAPAFPAEFEEITYPKLVGMLAALGFDLVTEVAFGADLVAQAYRRLLARNDGKRYIATTCPAVVSYVERYHPGLLPQLAPIVSPMVATSRALRRTYGDDLKIVFVGPCIAKKGEAVSPGVADEIDVVLTFRELRQMFDEDNIRPKNVEPRDFDAPHPAKGVLFPIARGMLETAEIQEDLLKDDVIAASGRHEFCEIIKEFEGGFLEARLLEILCCDGCIMGAGMTATAPLFRRRGRVTEYARLRMALANKAEDGPGPEAYADVPLERPFARIDVRLTQPSARDIQAALQHMGKLKPEDELNCGACGYATCLEHAVAVCEGLAENEMCLPYTIDQLRATCAKLEASNEELAVTREALIHSEKLASMGQLAAGIAHEVNNPLGAVLMLSNLLSEEHGGSDQLGEDLRMIASEANRCKKIVAGLLQFARQNKVDARRTDLQEIIRHTCRSVKPPENVRLRVEHEGEPPMAEIDRDQIIQVLTNMMTNAISAMPDGGELAVKTETTEHDVRIRISDTGTGIAKENMRKIFEPFFTTKKAGQGTGLGLAVTYGIIKMHRGDIRVESNADPSAGPTGTTFTITLPRRRTTVNGDAAVGGNT